MNRNETVYLYENENKPKVKLTLIKNSLKLQEIIDYFHNLQDLYNIEFKIDNTITDNLRITCCNIGIEPETLPFYIIEYDEIYDSFFIWKTDGEWDVNQMIRPLYQSHINPTKDDEFNNSWVRKFSRDKRLKTHSEKRFLIPALKQLNIDWSHINLMEFWTKFDNNYKPFINRNIAPINEYTMKSLISMSILKINIEKNQVYVKQKFIDYYNTMSVSREKSDISLIEINDSELLGEKVETMEESHEMARSSSEESILSPITLSNPKINNEMGKDESLYISPNSSVSPSPTINPIDNLFSTSKDTSSYTYINTLDSSDKVETKNNSNINPKSNTHMKDVTDNFDLEKVLANKKITKQVKRKSNNLHKNNENYKITKLK